MMAMRVTAIMVMVVPPVMMPVDVPGPVVVVVMPVVAPVVVMMMAVMATMPPAGLLHQSFTRLGGLAHLHRRNRRRLGSKHASKQGHKAAQYCGKQCAFHTYILHCPELYSLCCKY